MNYLIHHSIKDQKWGVRRFQNEDGILTEAGKKRYNAERKAVAEYRKKHPNTKLSYSEIAAMTEEERNA